LLSDERLDLVKMRVDVALRTGALPDSGMVARKLGSAKRVFCASPAYLARRGTPETPADLKHHDCIVTGGSTDGTSWVFAGDGGNETVAVNGRFSANVMSFALTAAIAGLGIAQVPEGLALPDLKAARLVPVLEPFVLDGGALYVVFPSNQHVSAAVRAFIDHVTAWAVSWPAREGTSAQH
ncbi:MAG: substrate binding domain-containing protein, partial [Devosia sp.]